MTAYALHHAVVLAVCLAATWWLPSSRWPSRAPRTALLSWQTTAMSGVLALIGLALSTGLAPYHRGVIPALVEFANDAATLTLPAGMGTVHIALVLAGTLFAGWLLLALIRSAIDGTTVRRRHRALLHLLARPDTPVSGVFTIDHPLVVAYCLPGIRPAIVISSGTLDLLDRAQLDAVLEHERAHARERHDLVLLPFVALSRAFARWAPICRVEAAVRQLIELRADDRAAHHTSPHTLADALDRFAAATCVPAPSGSMSAADNTGPRIGRLRGPRGPRRPHLHLLAAAIALTLVATPLSLYLFPA